LVGSKKAKTMPENKPVAFAKAKAPDASDAEKRLGLASSSSLDEIFSYYGTSLNGYSEEQAEESREKYGMNDFGKNRKDHWYKRLLLAFLNPFSIVLIILAVVTIVGGTIKTDSSDAQNDYITAIIIFAIVVLSTILRFVTEQKSSKAMEKLTSMVETTVSITRSGKANEIPLREVVVGDIVGLSNGDLIPADIRILSSKDFFVSQSALTGESLSIEKTADPDGRDVTLTDKKDLAFMGSTVLSGSAQGLVINVGKKTIFGQIAAKLSTKKEKTAFDKGVDSVSKLLIRFMLVMAPLVFIINGFTKNDWLEAFLFGISVAVGLTPEMLPMIVTSCLARGAIQMSKKKVIVKSIDSIQDFGAIDVLCTDKTGTLTEDRVALEDHVNLKGETDPRVLRHAYLNAYFQTGLKNLMDKSIIAKTEELSSTNPCLEGLATSFRKVDEIPFDFTRKRMSVVVEDSAGKRQLITKGAVEEITAICTYAEIDGAVQPLTDALKEQVLKTVQGFSAKGYRCIAVAQKNNPSSASVLGIKDESDMVLLGYLSFFDPPKKTAKQALDRLASFGVRTVILTGDNPEVTLSVANAVGMKNLKALLGKDIEMMDETTLEQEAETTDIFAKLSPEEKSRVVLALKNKGHVVGYMGDGINDAPALRSADIGISVDTAADIAKESAHVILLEKNLNVLIDGIIEGRRTYGNMIKYINMTASSNFGNMFSEILAAAFLPFLPMLPIHLLLLNLVGDIACSAIPWDNVDKTFLEKPRKWDASSIGRFMIVFGPTSSIFDWATYAVMFWVICPMMVGGAWGTLASGSEAQIMFIALFQTGWFVESMWTQTLVILSLRSPKIFQFNNLPSISLVLASLFAVAVVTVLPFIPFFSTILGFSALGWQYFLFLGGVVVAYLLLVSLTKHFYVKKRGSLY
jgi:Mg2+-importing ATPase